MRISRELIHIIKILESDNIHNVFFIGIGGISMSGIAHLLLLKGFAVWGCDTCDGSYAKSLRQAGAVIYIGHSASHITDDIDLVVYTAAIKNDNPELKAAAAKGIKTIDRAALLGIIMDEYPISISVAGTHGKTTTTSIISKLLLKRDPTVLVGGDYKQIGGNFRAGGSDLFITEACEYCDSFLKFRPAVGVILNIEPDHLDYFKDIAHIRRSFRTFAENIKDLLVINADIDGLSEITDDLSCRIVTFSINSANNITFNGDGTSEFDIAGLSSIKWGLSGRHNIENALAAYTAAINLYPGLTGKEIIEGLSDFKNAGRRFEHKGIHNGALIIDDYAHHPTEIETTLKSAAGLNKRKLICLFQPHTYTRTASLFDEFISSFKDADEVAFVDIYAARELDPGTVSSKLLSDAVAKTGKTAYYFNSLKEAAMYYAKHLTNSDILITMGAGDIYLAGEMILSGGIK